MIKPEIDIASHRQTRPSLSKNPYTISGFVVLLSVISIIYPIQNHMTQQKRQHDQLTQFIRNHHRILNQLNTKSTLQKTKVTPNELTNTFQHYLDEKTAVPYLEIQKDAQTNTLTIIENKK